MKEHSVMIEALEFDGMKAKIEDVSSIKNSNNKLYFIYDPSGWRFRILILTNQILTTAFYGELFKNEYKSTAKNSPIINNLKKLNNIDILLLPYQPNSGAWPLAKESLSSTYFPLDDAIQVNNANELDRINTYAIERREKIKKNIIRRTKLSKSAQEFIIHRSFGCCEYYGCAKKLYQLRNGTIDNIAYYAHIIGASENGPRSKYIESHDEINDPRNIMLLCDEDHRLVDKVDVEGHSTKVLRNMLEKRQQLTNLLSIQLKNEERIPIVLVGDILNFTAEISNRELLDALVNFNMIPKDGEIKKPLQLLDTQVEIDSYQIYWSHFLTAKKGELDAYKRILRDNSDPLAIFPLGSMPFLFLMGYMTGEVRPIQLFHRSRDRQTWIWPHDEHAQTSFTIEFRNDLKISEEAILNLSITAELEDNRIPDDLRNLPMIKITGDKFHQDPFNSYQDFELLKRTIQDAINKVLDDLKIKTLHIMAIAPAISVFAIGQKIQRRNASKIIMYQVDRDTPAYPVLILEKDKVSSYDHPDISYTL